MRTKILMSLGLVLLAFATSAQTNGLVGNWNFETVENTKSMDAAAAEKMAAEYGATVLSFAEDGTYSGVLLNKKDKGQYALSADGAVIKLVSQDGTTTEVKVVSLTDSHATLVIGKGTVKLKKQKVAVSGEGMKK